MSPSRVIARAGSLEETVRAAAASTRSSSPCASSEAACCRCASLLECRLNGVQVTDLARFFERVHGHVPIDSLKASWLIYGNGFRQAWLRGVVKRTFDIVVAIGAADRSCCR